MANTPRYSKRPGNVITEEHVRTASVLDQFIELLFEDFQRLGIPKEASLRQIGANRTLDLGRAHRPAKHLPEEKAGPAEGAESGYPKAVSPPGARCSTTSGAKRRGNVAEFRRRVG
jgi:hypothetical protein